MIQDHKITTLYYFYFAEKEESFPDFQKYPVPCKKFTYTAGKRLQERV